MDAIDTLQNRFGFANFRPGQQTIVEHIANGGDALVVMPTGAGKSLCFQAPALMRGPTTIVVSPLIALMKDQVDHLEQLNIRATCLNSSVPSGEYKLRFERLMRGEVELLYVAPERFTPSFLKQLSRIHVSMLAIDEAHCLSVWGHDFRPDYLRLGRVREALNNPPTVALTATATPEVQRDIRKTLNLDSARTFIRGFDRENLVLEVVSTSGKKEKDELLAELVQPGPSLVYCSTRKNVERATQALRAAGVRAGMYHAGLSMGDRTRIQDAFMKGDVPIVVATNAFGMGIDKRDIRNIVHYDMPGTIEAYYQEIGRAGRDGRTSRAVLLFNGFDRRIHEFFIDTAHPPSSSIHDVHRWLLNQGQNPVFATLEQVSAALTKEGNDRAASACISVLVREGHVRKISPSNRSGWVTIPRKPAKTPSGFRGTLWNLLMARAENYGATIQFVPDQWARQLSVDRDKLNSTLRGLEERGLISYQAPERCGGFALIKPREPLVLDEQAMRKRRGREYNKLDKMEAYTSAPCRRRYIVEYFGEKAPFERCGTCDACRGGGAEILTAVPPTPDQSQVILKVLSSVARMERHTNRQGWSINLIAKTLVGSREKSILSWGFDQLSTHGILAPRTGGAIWRIGEVSDLVSSLVDAGALQSEYITQTVNGKERTYKHIQLNEMSWQIMRQKDEGFTLVFPHASRISRKRPKKGGSTPKGVPSDLLSTLRDIRRQLANTRNVPAYVIAPNRTLEDMARLQPQKPADMTKVHGMGTTRNALYGKAFLQAITSWSANR